MNDRGNHRVQVFDENGKFQYAFSMGQNPSDIHLIYMGADRSLWAFDRGTSKMLKYDPQGHLLYTWSSWGDFPGGFCGVHWIQRQSGRKFLYRRKSTTAGRRIYAAARRQSKHAGQQAGYSAWK